jgi:hypothetical protein
MAMVPEKPGGTGLGKTKGFFIVIAGSVAVPL